MLNPSAVLQQIPFWVPVLFLVLVGYGYSLSRDRTVAQRRTIVVPLVLSLVSLSGVTSSFGGQALALLAWAAGFAAVAASTHRWVDVRSVTFDAATRRFHVPGSWVPLTLMMSLFVLKFAVGMTLGLHPMLAGSNQLAVPCSLLYGAFAGGFLARSIALWQLARLQATSTSNREPGAQR
jgi:hypothetical protein